MAVVPECVCGVAATLQVPQHQVGQDVPVRLLKQLLEQAQADDADLGERGRDRGRESYFGGLNSVIQMRACIGGKVDGKISCSL